MEKICNTCNISLDIIHFYKNYTKCKNCYKIYIQYSHDTKCCKTCNISLHISDFHKKQLPKNYEIVENNIKKGSIWNPINSVGLYIPLVVIINQ